MKIKCQKCGHEEQVNMKFFVKVLGGTVSGFGVWAWPAYLFAGTGLAMPICLAIVAGGSAIMMFSDEIALWFSKRYNCPKCGAKNWKGIEG